MWAILANKKNIFWYSLINILNDLGYTLVYDSLLCLEEDTRNPTFPMNMYTSRTYSVPNSHFSRDIFHALFP